MIQNDAIILLTASLIFIQSLFFVPKAKRQEAQFIFLFTQFPTWLFGLIVVELGLLNYPIHELAEANSTSFIFEYMVLPIYCIHFNTHFPLHVKKIIKLYYFCWSSLPLTCFEVLVE